MRKNKYIWYALIAVVLVLIIIAVAIVVKNNNKDNNGLEQTTENQKIEEQTIDFNDLLKGSATTETTEITLAQGQSEGTTEKIVAQEGADGQEQSKSDVIDNFFSDTSTIQSENTENADNKEADESQKQEDTDVSDSEDDEDVTAPTKEETTQPSQEQEETTSSAKEPEKITSPADETEGTTSGTDKSEEQTTQHPDPDGPGWSVWVK